MVPQQIIKKKQSTLDKIKGYLFPYHSCVYYSNLSKEEILSRISERTEPEQFFRMRGFLVRNKETKEFEGTVGIDQFKINKIHKRKKSYAPVISGQLSRANQYTKLNLSMRLSYVIIALIPLWLLFFVNFIVVSNFSVEQFNQFDFDSWFPILFIFVFYAILTGSFHYHLVAVKKSIEKIIEPVDKNNTGTSGASWIIRN